MAVLAPSVSPALPHASRCEFGTLPDITLLPDLWRRRTRLSNLEMGYVYLLVRNALHAYDPSELRALREDKEDLVAQFIFSKVLRLDMIRHDDVAASESAPTNQYALCAYFRRYLIDRLRNASHQRDVSIEIDGVAAQVDARMQSREESAEAILAEHGLDEARVRSQARAFVKALDMPDRFMLAGSLGACSGQKGGLKGVADQHGVHSYHHRARKLGVAMKKSATPADFAQTRIGCWLSDVLHLSITADNREVILAVLDLLAAEANA